jgi:hypothetical protein
MSFERRRARCDVGHRRGFLVASAALGAALLLPSGASAAQIKVLQGVVRVNGKKASKATTIRPGDTVETTQGARLAFVVGDDAFLLRGESKLMLEHTSGEKALLVTGLRLLSGGLLAAFAPGARRIETPTATAGIRGTAVYIEASKEQTYFCTCYGVVELRDRAGMEKKTVISGYHTPNMIFANPAERGKMADAEVKDHTDEELVMLERLVGRTSPIVLRNKKLKDAQTDEGEPRPAPEPKQVEEKKAPEEKKAAEEQKPPPDSKPAPERNQPAKADAARDQSATDAGKTASRPADAQTGPKDGAPAEGSDQMPKPSTKKTRPQKQSKAKVKPPPEPAPQPEAAPGPEKSDIPELGPSPMPPAEPQPPAQEWRLPPPRLDQ